MTTTLTTRIQTLAGRNKAVDVAEWDLAPGDTVEARVTVREIEHPKRRVTLDCACRVGDRVVLKGEALVLAPSAKFD